MFFLHHFLLYPLIAYTYGRYLHVGKEAGIISVKKGTVISILRLILFMSGFYKGCWGVPGRGRFILLTVYTVFSQQVFLVREKALKGEKVSLVVMGKR